MFVIVSEGEKKGEIGFVIDKERWNVAMTRATDILHAVSGPLLGAWADRNTETCFVLKYKQAMRESGRCLQFSAEQYPDFPDDKKPAYRMREAVPEPEPPVYKIMGVDGTRALKEMTTSEKDIYNAAEDRAVQFELLTQKLQGLAIMDTWSVQKKKEYKRASDDEKLNMVVADRPAAEHGNGIEGNGVKSDGAAAWESATAAQPDNA